MCLVKIFAISDLHLSINNPKPMDIFGPVWDNYVEKIFDDWKTKVGTDDVVLLAGDFSWAMKLDDAVADLNLVASLPGKKIMIRGNHDYWWDSLSKLRDVLPKDFYVIQNDSIKIGKYIFCGSRGWTFDDEKLKNRELLRLEMSIKSAINQKLEGDEIICMIHFPPYEKGYKESEFTNLIEKYNIKKVVYGHLHGVWNSKTNKIVNINGVQYFLTSCDLVENKLTLIAED